MIALDCYWATGPTNGEQLQHGPAVMPNLKNRVTEERFNFRAAISKVVNRDTALLALGWWEFKNLSHLLEEAFADPWLSGPGISKGARQNPAQPQSLNRQAL